MIALLHLSDIHCTGPETPFLGDSAALLDAVLPPLREHRPSYLCVLLSGDIAFSGREEEYVVAWEWFESVATAIREDIGIPVHFVAVPGNHDCNLSEDLPARAEVVAALLGNPQENVTDEIIQVATECQSQFFELRDVLSNETRPSARELVWTVDFSENEESVRFVLLNSAWLSTLNEEQGKSWIPVAAFPELVGTPDIVVGVSHHPFNWFESNNALQVKSWLYDHCDLIVTGHEHTPSAGVVQIAEGGTHQYIEGPKFAAESTKDGSAFNLVMLDVKRRDQLLVRYEWNGHLYSPTKKWGEEWTSFQVNRMRRANAFDTLPAFNKWLDDLGIVIEHPDKGRLSRQDVFVYPDLREVPLRSTDEVQRLIRTEGLLDYLADSGVVTIQGPEGSGKTTLAKQLWLDARERGLTPVYAKAEQLRSTKPEAIGKAIAKALEEQYAGDPVEAWRQLSPADRIVIVDNCGPRVLPPESQRALMNWFEDQRLDVLFMCDEPLSELQGVVGRSARTDHGVAGHLRLLPLGHSRRDQLAEKWLILDTAVASDPEELSRRIVNATRLMTTTIGRNFLPALPVFILGLLHADKANQPLDLTASTHGYYYELLIRAQLFRTGAPQKFDIYIQYLSELAWATRQSINGEWTDVEWREFHLGFERARLLSLDYAGQVGYLERAELVERTEDGFRFRYPYIRYYFLATYLRDHIQDPAMADIVRQAAETLDSEESANVLLFLAHLTRESILVDSVLETSRKRFPSLEAATLDKAELPLGEIKRAIDTVELIDAGAGELRRAMLQRMDEAGVDEHVKPELSPELATLIQEMTVAFKSLQLLGQILRNFPGSLTGASKLAIASEAYGVGLRTLNAVFGVAREASEAYAEVLVQAVLEGHPTLEAKAIRERAAESFFFVVTDAAYGMIRRIALSVGHPELGAVYQAVLDANGSLAVKLVNLAIALEQGVAVPEKLIVETFEECDGNIIAQSVVRGLVVHHFHMFDVRFDLKQRVCNAIGIRFHTMAAISPRGRLLTRGNRAS